MIISHRHRVIFQHCRKTAGTTVQVTLAQHLGPEDVMVGSWTEAMGEGIKPNRAFWRAALRPAAFASLAKGALAQRGLPSPEYMNRVQKGHYFKNLGKMPEHASAAETKTFAPEAWGSYFKFCFVRNPYSQVVSAWRFSVRERKEELTFKEFLQLIAVGKPDKRIPARPFNWPIYTIDDTIAVDFVGKHETFERDFRQVLETLKLPQPKDFVSAKKGDGRDYRDAYGPDEKQLVQTLFAKEIDAHGYTF